MSNHNSCGLCSIEMKNISVTSGEDILLDNINLTFHCGELTALIGKNGAGKTTLLRTLLGERHYKGSISFTDHHGVVLPMPRIGYVPQHLDFDKSMPISVSDFIAAAKGGSPVWFGKQKKMQAHIREILEDMECGYLAERRLGALSGGELQRVAIAASIMKEADTYFFDEPSSYLDIYQRIKVARIIQSLAETKQVVVIEHDLAILDFLADSAYLVYGSEGAYGVFAQPRQVRTAINTYLDGYMREENIRFRDTQIRFESHPPRDSQMTATLLEYGELECDYHAFKLHVDPGSIMIGESIGVVGPNAIGKTTFVKMLAGVQEPTFGELDAKVKVSYKPQYIAPDFDGTVRELFMTANSEFFGSGFFESEIAHPLSLKRLYEKNVKTLSGGELQRVAIAICLSMEAEIYLIDEPSAYLDSNQRMEAAKTIRRVMEKRGRSALIVDHDIYFLDMVSDTMMVFEGKPGSEGNATGPYDMRDGMNKFLAGVDVTFRRDNDTDRPRINKPGSRLDREQKEKGEYYYSSASAPSS